MADIRVPEYLGRVLAEDGTPAGTCFQVAPGVLVTAWHVLADVGAGEVGAAVSLDRLGGGPVLLGEVVRADAKLDLAVLRTTVPFQASVPGLAATDGVPIATETVVTGVSVVEDPGDEYRYLDAVGAWSGGTVRNEGVRLGRLETSALVPGMSGAPVRHLTDDVVIGVVSARYNSVNGWLRDTVWVARTEDLASMLVGVTDVALAAHAPGQLSTHVPHLPRNFVPRAEELTALAATLLSESDEPVVVHGMPGIGKTVLAIALAHDKRVRESFPDGVLWMTLGRERNITRSQALLAEDLGDGTRAFSDPEQGKSRLKTLLAARTCMLVLDDVWFLEDLEAFDVLGPHCRMVITTRDARVGVPLAAVDYLVNVLPEDLAVELLTKWAGQDTDRERAREVVWACGRLPLALSMIGAMVRGRGDRWDNVLAKLHTADLGSIRQHFLGYPYDSLLKALQVSVDSLPDTGVAARYLDFALFLEDVAVPEAVLLLLWQIDGLSFHQAQDDIDLLVERSLVQRAADGRLSLHDLLFDYVRMVRAEAGDGQSRHRKLLAAYRAQCPHDWPSGPNDGYFFEYLSRHLVEADQADELHRLLGVTAEGGGHAWYGAKRALGEVAGFLSDVNLAWHLAETTYDSADLVRAAESVGLQIRYATITASLNSLAGNMPPQMLAAVLAHDLQGAREVLTYASRAPEPAQRCAALVALAPYLPDDLVDEALAIANVIEDEVVRAGAVGRLAARLIELGQIGRGRVAIESLQDLALRATALAVTARHRAEVAEEAIRIAGELRSRPARANALSQVAEQLADCGLSDDAVDAAQRIGDAGIRWGVLGRIASHLPQALAEAAVTRAYGIPEAGKRVRALVPLLPRLTESQVHAVLEDISELSNRAEEAAAYAEVARYLSEPLATSIRERALERALKVKDPFNRGQAVVTVIAHLPEPLARIALDRVNRWKLQQAPALAALAARLTVLGHSDEALGLVESITDADQRATVLAAIASDLPRAALGKALALAGVIGDATVRAHAMSRLVPYLVVAGRLEEAKEVTHQLYDADFTAAADWIASAVAIAHHLPDAERNRLLDHVWHVAVTMLNLDERIFALIHMSPDRPLDVLAELSKDVEQAFHFSFWWFFLRTEQYAVLLGAVAEAGYTEEAVSLIRAIIPREPTRFDSHADEYEKRQITLIRAVLLSHLLTYVSADMRDDLSDEVLRCLESNSTNIIFIVDAGDFEDMVFARIVQNLPLSLLDRAAELLASRTKHRDLVLPETAVALVLRVHRSETHPDVEHALETLLDMRTPKVPRERDNRRVSIRDDSVTTRCELKDVDYDLTAALPRIARGLPRYAIDRLLERTSSPAEPASREPIRVSRAKQRLFSALAIRLAELGDLDRALDYACRLSEPGLRYQALDGVGTALAALSRETLTIICADRRGGSLFRELSNQSREDMLADLAALTPTIMTLGGDDVVTAAIATIRETGRWWP